VAGALGFLFIMNPAGPVNGILRFLHLPHPLWFEDPHWSKPGLLLLGVWGVGQTMIIMLAALLDVPMQLYEAADLEGAGPWQRFRFVTLPMISPVIFFAAVIGIIDGFQYFTEAYVIGGGTITAAAPVLGQPQGSLLFYSLWMYQQGWSYSHFGYASAMAWVMFLVVLACVVVMIRTQNRWVHYSGGFR
jgi:multiple sugar transport system permease protein